MGIKSLFKLCFPNKEARHRAIIQMTSWMHDSTYLKLLFMLIMHQRLHLAYPNTYSEKLQWYKLNYHDPLMTACADKLLVREYVAKQGLTELLVPLIDTFNSANDIAFESLPHKCILKCNHNSSGSYKWDSDRDNNIEEIRKNFKEMLGINAYWLAREWAYKEIKPQIVCEQWIEAEAPIVDIKVFCFNGEPDFFFYDTDMNDNFGGHSIGNRAVFDSHLHVLDVETQMKRMNPSDAKLPSCIDKVLAYAKKLSAPFPHVRVDFFMADDRLYFSELTFYPSGGLCKYTPQTFDEEIGKKFCITKYRKNMK